MWTPQCSKKTLQRTPDDGLPLSKLIYVACVRWAVEKKIREIDYEEKGERLNGLEQHIYDAFSQQMGLHIDPAATTCNRSFLYKSGRVFFFTFCEPPEEFSYILARARNTNKFFLKKRCHVGLFFFFVQLDRKHSADTLDRKVVNFPPPNSYSSLPISSFFYCTIWQNLFYSGILK